MAKTPTTIRMYGEAPGSIVDGPGIRYGVFCQGCAHNCPGCHNPKSHDYNGGNDRKISEILANIHAAESTHGVTLSGGEPFDQARAMAKLAAQLNEEGYDIWAYSGYTFEQLFEISLQSDDATKGTSKLIPSAVGKLLANLDVLVDGPFIEKKKSYDALYRGSTNQRLVDIPKSLRAGKFIEWKEEFELPKIPESW